MRPGPPTSHPVSFMLYLEVTDLAEQGRAAEASCRLRQAWPVRFLPGRPRRWWRVLAMKQEADESRLARSQAEQTHR